MILKFMLDSLWQGAIVVGATTLALQLLPARNATTRYAAWFLALVALAAVPVASMASHLGAQLLAALPHRSAAGHGVFSLVGIGALPRDAERWLMPRWFGGSAVVLTSAIFWVLGSAAAIGRLTVSFVRIERVRRRATPFARVDGIVVLSSRDLEIPIATGVISPAIILPQRLVETMSENERRCTIEHELAHLRRGDVSANIFQRLVEAILFWNPWVFIVARAVIREREAACDDMAVHRIGRADDYAYALAALGRRVSGGRWPLLTPSAFSTRNALVGRIERLAGDRSPKDFTLNYAALGAVTMLFAFITLALQALLPVNVQAAPQPLAAGNGLVASSCATPNAEPKALNPAAPDLPKSQMPNRKVTALVTVTVAPNGKPTAAHVYRSSGYAAVDRAVTTAALKSTYSPKVVNCVAVASTYLFRADFAP